MARTDDEKSEKSEKSVISIPQTLVVIAGILLVARVADLVVNFGHAAEPPRAVGWQTTAALEEVPPRDKNTADKPVQELSKESQEELNKMLASCRESKKTLLLQFYAHWSDPCRKMEASSMSNAQVKELIDRNFVPVRVTDKMKEYGKNTRLVSELQKRYRIFAFPTLLVVGYDGEPVATLIGNCSSLTTYRFLSRTVYSLNSSRPLQRHTAQNCNGRFNTSSKSRS